MSSSIDRLSDDVICHILSFLPTKTSASTSVLARRWRFLWAHVPNLYFKGDDFEDESQASDIIHRVMALHRAKTINTFRIFDDVVCNGYQLATWISHAVNRGVRNLYLDFINPGYVVESFTPPRCLLTCNTLVDLKLRCCRGIISSGGNVFWPSLKKLHLSRIVYENDDCLPRLLSGCPVLEDLIVEGCYKHNPNDDYDYDDYDDDSDDLGCVFVSSPTIKTLNVDLWEGCGVLKINAPSLVYLKVNNCFLEDIASLVTMTSLIEAHFSLIGDWVEDIDDPEYSEKFINCLCNLKCLKISIDDVEKLVNIAGLRSTVYFNNLTRLELHLVFHFHELVMFLEVADNLEHLTFTLGGRHYTYKEPRLVPMCMLSRLKTVRINPFFGFNVHDFEAISYVFWNAQVLEWMEIHSDSYCSIHTEELVLLIRIPLLERGSALCRLAFY